MSEAAYDVLLPWMTWGMSMVFALFCLAVAIRGIRAASS